MSFAFEPLNLALMVWIAGVLLSRRHRLIGRCLYGAAILFCYGLATPLVSGLLMQAIERQGEQGELGSGAPQVIVVLGGDLRHNASDYGGDTVGRLSLERIRYGARLYRQSGLPVLLSGGIVGGSTEPVSQSMKRALEDDFGIPVSWTENRSRNTFENAKYSAEILRSSGVETIYLVTHSWHMARAREAFQLAGIKVVAKPTGSKANGADLSWPDFVPRAVSLTDSAFALHEIVGRLWYHIAYYSRAAAL